MDSKIYSWMEQYTGALRDTFGSRLWFVGLQGSYARGEATAQSDIDAVVILDRVSPADLAAYSAMLDRLPDRDKVCGFISGKDELFSWEPSDLFQFLYDTTPVLGSLELLRERVSREDIRRAAWTGSSSTKPEAGAQSWASSPIRPKMPKVTPPRSSSRYSFTPPAAMARRMSRASGLAGSGR